MTTQRVLCGAVRFGVYFPFPEDERVYLVGPVFGDSEADRKALKIIWPILLEMLAEERKVCYAVGLFREDATNRRGVKLVRVGETMPPRMYASARTCPPLESLCRTIAGRMLAEILLLPHRTE